jgi:6-phosphogluconolactonase (cycloisomerase 2 family)
MPPARVAWTTLAAVLCLVAVPAAAARRSCEADLEKAVTKQAGARFEAAAAACTENPTGICFLVRSRAIRAKQLKRCRAEAVTRLFANRCVARETDCVPGAVGAAGEVAACVSCAVPAEIDCVAAALFAPGNAPPSCGTAVFPIEEGDVRAAPAPAPVAAAKKKRAPTAERCLRTIVRELGRTMRASLRQTIRGFPATAALNATKLNRDCGRRIPDSVQYRGCPGLLGCPSDLVDTRAGFEACAACLVRAAATTISARLRPGLCGNGALNGPGETCETHDVCTAGLHCADPSADIRQCTCYQACGDGVRQEYEECDPTAAPTGCDAESGCAAEGLGACTCVTHPRFALVANAGDDTLSVVALDSDTGRLRHLSYGHTGTGLVGVAAAARGRFVYTANQDTNNVSAFSLDPVTGLLASLGAVQAGIGPTAIAAHPGGGFVYVVNGVALTVSAWAVDQTGGGLVPVAGSPFAVGGTAPSTLAIDPTGRFAYVGDALAAPPSIAPFRIAGDGALVPLGVPLAAAGGPTALAISADGRYLYAALANGQVGVFLIDPTTGVLDARPPATAGTQPSAVATDLAGRFVYVANEGSGDVHAFRVDPATGALASAGVLGVGAAPVGLGVEPSGRFLHVAVRDANEAVVLAIDQTTGALARVDRLRVRLQPAAFAFTRGGTPVTFAPAFAAVANPAANGVTLHPADPASGTLGAGSETAAGPEPRGLALHPNGRIVYVANRAGGSVSALGFDAAGTSLAPLGSGSDPTPRMPIAIAVAPSGRYVFAGNDGATKLSVFQLDAAGVPTWLTEQPAGPGVSAPTAVALDPAGRLLFVASAGAADTVTSFIVGATTGALTAADAKSAGSDPSAVAVHPSGRFLYAANRGSANVSQYEISPTGGLTPLDPATATAGDQPGALAVDPRGRFAWVGNLGANDLTVYTIGSDGTLAAAAETVQAFADPTALAVDPSGTFLYVGTEFSNVVAFRIDPATGGLTQLGAVDVSSQPSAILVVPSVR